MHMDDLPPPLSHVPHHERYLACRHGVRTARVRQFVRSARNHYALGDIANVQCSKGDVIPARAAEQGVDAGTDGLRPSNDPALTDDLYIRFVADEGRQYRAI